MSLIDASFIHFACAAAQDDLDPAALGQAGAGSVSERRRDTSAAEACALSCPCESARRGARHTLTARAVSAPLLACRHNFEGPLVVSDELACLANDVLSCDGLSEALYATLNVRSLLQPQGNDPQ